MTKQEAIEYMENAGYVFDQNKRVTFKVCDHSNNPVSPEKVCYKIVFYANGERKRFAIWPNTVGYQGY